VVGQAAGVGGRAGADGGAIGGDCRAQAVVHARVVAVDLRGIVRATREEGDVRQHAAIAVLVQDVDAVGRAAHGHGVGVAQALRVGVDVRAAGLRRELGNVVGAQVVLDVAGLP